MPKTIHKIPEIPQEYIKWFYGGFPRNLVVRGIFSACEASEYQDLVKRYPGIVNLPFAHFTTRVAAYSKQFAPSNKHNIPCAINNSTVEIPFMDINTDDFGTCIEAMLTAACLTASALPGRGAICEVFAEKTDGMLAIGASLANKKAAAISMHNTPGMLAMTVLTKRGISMSSVDVREMERN